MTFPDLIAKKLALLKELIPSVARVVVLFHSSSNEAEFMTTARNAGRVLGIDIHIIEVRSPVDFDNAFRQITQIRPQAVSVSETAMMFAHRGDLAERARKIRLPAMGEWRPSAIAGYFASYGADLADLLRRTAIHVDKVLKGIRPGDLPIERPTKFDFVINLKTAKVLGLTIPPSLLARADQVIEWTGSRTARGPRAEDTEGGSICRRISIARRSSGCTRGHVSALQLTDVMPGNGWWN